MMEKKASPSFVVRDTAGVLGRMYGARNTPQLFVIDPEGVLRYSGAIDAAGDEHCEVESLPPPCRIGLWAVRQGRKRKAGVGEADLLGLVAQHLICSLDHLPLMLGDSLPTGLVDPVADDELVDLGHAAILQPNLSLTEPWT